MERTESWNGRSLGTLRFSVPRYPGLVREWKFNHILNCNLPIQPLTNKTKLPSNPLRIQKQLNTKMATQDNQNKKFHRYIKMMVLEEQFDAIKKAKSSNPTGRIPNGLIHKLIENTKSVAPWLTYNGIMGYYRKRAKQVAINTENEDMEMADDVVAPDGMCASAGRPKGSTDKKRKITEENVVATMNEIALKYNASRGFYNSKYQRNKKIIFRRKPGYLTSLITEIKVKNNVPEDVIISEGSIRQRIKRGNLYTNGGRGPDSPLLALEPTIVKTIIQISRIRQCITPSTGLKLVNSIIEGTQVQNDLIQFKSKLCGNSDGKVGRNYWRLFMKRNRHKIVSKRGQKYELDRAAWSTYRNFDQMYNQVAEEMIEAKVARKIYPTWMNAK